MASQSVFQYSLNPPADRLVLMEKVIDDEHVNINHIIVQPGQAVPIHVSNSWVHQIVVRGTLSLSLEDESPSHYSAGSIIAVPFNHKMEIKNLGPEPLEFFVVKAPNPRNMPPVKQLRDITQKDDTPR